MTKLILSGCLGRMGRVITALCEDDPQLAIVAGIDPVGSAAALPYPVFSTPEECDVEADVLVDFSAPAALGALLPFLRSRGLPAVLASTGYDESQLSQIDQAAQTLPIFRSANLSLGVNLLMELTRRAAQVLGEDFDIEIVETHHNQKADAPSGTAKALLRSVDPSGAYECVYGRQGRPGARGHEIGMHALRGGTVAGEHSVHFFGAMEELELRHRADSREIFARGALRAAAFAVRAKPGLYNMEDVLFGGTGA